MAMKMRAASRSIKRDLAQRIICKIAAAVEQLENRTLLTSIVSNAVTGNWSTPSTWVGGVVPGGSDNATIVAGASISVTNNINVENLTTQAGSDLAITGGGNLGILNYNTGDASTIAGTLEIDSLSDISVDGIISPLTISGNSTISGSFQGGTTDNTGTMTLTGGGAYGSAKLINDGTINNPSGGIVLGGGGTITNQTDGTFNLTNDSGPYPTTYPTVSGGTFINKGILNKTGGTGVYNFPDYATNETFNSSTFENIGGTVNINSGTFLVKGNAYLEGGTINVAANSVFTFDDPSTQPYDSSIGITGTVTGSGAGSIVFAQGDYQPHSPAGGGAAGTLNFPSGLLTLGNIAIDTYNGFTLDNTGFMNFNSSVQTGGLWLINDGTIQNTGAGSIVFTSVTNDSTGLIDLKTDAGLISGTVNIQQNLLNSGTLRKSGGTGTSNVSALLTNTTTGNIDVESGTMNLDSATNIYYEGGATNVGPGATLDLDPASAVVVGAIWTSTGGGTINLTGGYIRGRNSITGNEGASAGVLDFAPNIFFVTGGFINNSNEGLTNTGTINITTQISVGSFANSGTVLLNGPQFFFNGIITNLAGGVFEFDTPATIGQDGVFINQGTLLMAATGTIDLSSFHTEDNIGTEALQNSGTIEATSGLLIVPSDVFSAGSDGNLDVQAGAGVEAISGGTIELVSSWDEQATTITTVDGTAIVGGAGTPIPALAPLAKVNGTFELRAGASFTTAGSLTNTGMLNIGGNLTVAGNLTESGDAATINFAVSGAPGSGGAPVLTVNGNTTLAGNLAASETAGYAAPSGTAFTVATFSSPSNGIFANTSGVGPAFGVVSTPTEITLFGTGNSGGGGGKGTADLAVTSVIGPTGSAPGSPITVTFTVTNEGTGDATGSWLDSVFLTQNGTIDNNSILLGRYSDGQMLAPGASYTQPISTFLPLSPAGNYTIVVETDSGLKVPDLNRANNVGVSASFATSFPSFALGQPITDTINNGQDKIYLLHLPAGGDVSIAANFSVGTEADLYGLYSAIPSTTQFDESLLTTKLTTAQLISSTGAPGALVIPVHQAGNYYVLVHGREGANGNSTFTLTPTEVGFGAVSITPQGIVQNQGNFTTTIKGSGFTASTTVALVMNGTPLAFPNVSTQVQLIDPNTLSVSFYFDFPTPGTYDLQVTNGSNTATLPHAFNIGSGSGNGGNLTYNLVIPAVSRGDLNGTAYLEYSNTGFLDIPAPFFVVFGTNTEFELAGQTSFSDGAIEALGISSTGIAGTLAPGQGGTIPITYRQISIVGHQNIQLQVVAVDTLPPFDLSTLKADLQPANEPNDAWDAIWSNFTTTAAANQNGLTGVLRDAANQLSLRGVRTPDVAILMNYALQSAGDFGAITQRYELTAFGRGQADPYAQVAAADSNGNVTISAGGAERFFVKQANGTYQPSADDTGTLSLASGVYTLRETTGQTTVFNTDGTLNYYQDINGNRLTAQYTSGLLAALVATDGDTYTFTYNAGGLITQVTDPVGRVTTYSYDSNQQLVSVATPQGTTQFNYYSGTDLADMYAITSIVFPDGTARDYTYDSQGRLFSQSRGDGSQMITYSYSSVSAGGIGVSGTVTATDALGNTTISTLADGQGVTSVTNGLSNIASIAYDADGRPTSTTTPGGFASSITYNAAGTIASTTDALGNTTSFSYDSTLDKLLQLTDANGNQTHFTYDANGNLVDETDAAGNATTLGYDSTGYQTSLVSAAGRTIATTYNSVHLITSQTYADGSTVTFTYDAHRNLLSAVDSLNGTTTYTYDSADRLTSITGPTGLSLTYVYNAGGQLIQKTDQTGFQTNYAYNAAGQLAQLTSSSGAVLVSYAYDAAGNLTRTTNANGTFTTYTFDAANEITDMTNKAQDGTVQSEFTYTYNANGQQSSMTTSAGTTNYTYDADGQLTHVALPGGRTIVYAYDAVGNRTTVSDSAVSSVTYSVNNLDEYVTVGSTTYTYDHDGNLLSSTDLSGTTTYTYNDRNQLASEVTPTDTFVYHYDALGNRVAVTDNGVTTRYLIDPTGISSVAGTYDASGNVISHFIYGLGLVGAVSASGSDSFYAFDASGNTADITNSSGAITSSYTYLPFGQILTSTGASNLFTFAGQLGVQNTGDGLYFMRVRSYSPTLGRFIQKDPASLTGGDVNLYRYANNDPVNNADPTGQDGFIIGAAGAALRTVGQTLVNPTGLGTNALFNLVRTGGISALTPVAEVGAETAITTTAVTFTNAAVPVVNAVTVNGVSTIATSAPVYVAGAASVPLAPAALAAAILLAPAGYEATDNYIRSHYPDGFPVPVQDVINPVTYQRTIKRPLIQDLVDDFIRLNGHPPDQSQLNTLIQYANSVDNGNAALYIQTHYSKQFPTQFVNARDPNNIFGPTGFGTAGFVQANTSFPYEITFENETTASAPAKVVTITEQLDSNLDWTTFQLTSLGFGSNVINVPAGLTAYNTSVDISASLRVDIAAAFNVLTGAVTWTFTSIDPSTGDVPSDALAGFLPPDDAAGDGAGYVSYTIQPLAAPTTGTQVHAQATITFDGNDPISTPNILNTLDAVAPTSTITALPATQSRTHFTVAWSGSDDTGGSGIAGYTIYVSTDGGAYLPWLTNTTATSAVFAGAPGHTYAFFSAATDNAGNLETTVQFAEATTTVPPIARNLTVTQGHSVTFTDAGGQKVTITLTGPGTATLDFLTASGSADPIDIIITGTTAKSSFTIKDTGGLTLTDVSITGSLAKFNASKANLTGDFSITGTLGSLALANLTDATIEIDGAGLATSFKLGALTDVAITDAGAIKTFSALSWTNGSAASDSLSGASVGTIQIKGAFDANVTLTTLSSFKAGSITAGTWTLSSIAKLQAASISNATFTLTSLGALTLNGALANSSIRTTGNIGKITVNGAANSSIFAGVNSLVTSALPTAADFTSASSIGSFTDKGKSAFSDTFIAASSITAASLANVTTNNAGVPFGIATESLKSFRLSQPKQKPIHYTSKEPASVLSSLPGDLRVEILNR